MAKRANIKRKTDNWRTHARVAMSFKGYSMDEIKQADDKTLEEHLPKQFRGD